MAIIKHSPLALKYYREQLSLSIELLAKKTGITPAKVAQGELSNSVFTVKQIQKLAKVLMIADFSLLSDVIKDIAIPDEIDYRNHTNPLQEEEQYLLQKTIRDIAGSREDYFYTYDCLEISPNRFALELSGKDVIADATTIRQFLGVDENKLKQYNGDDYYRAWRNLVEYQDIIVLEIARARIGSEGMALYYPTLPVIAILSSGQSASRKLFTMIHELVHLGLRQSTVDGSILEEKIAVERYCNQVAGHVLVPEHELDKLFKPYLSLEDNINHIRSRLKASKQAIAIQLLLTHRIKEVQFDDYINQQQSTGFGKTGKQYTAYNRFGRNFVQQVVSAVWDDSVSVSAALKILKLDSVEQLSYLEQKVFA